MKHADPLDQVITSWRANTRATQGEHLARTDFGMLLTDGVPPERIIEGIQLHCAEDPATASGVVARKIRNRWKMDGREEKAIQSRLEQDDRHDRAALRARLEAASRVWHQGMEAWRKFLLYISKHYDAAFVSWFCAYELVMRESHTTHCLGLSQYDAPLRDFEARESIVCRPHLLLGTDAEHVKWMKFKAKGGAVEVSEAAPVGEYDSKVDNGVPF